MADVLHFKSVTSTNDVAAQHAREGAAHLTVVTADQQTNGRGRLGRIWKTFPEGGLAMSVVVRTSVDVLPLVVSTVVHKAFCNLGANLTAIKWPNDILGITNTGPLKLCGILIESFAVPNQPQQRFYVVGIGVNVNTPPEGMPDDIAATTLQEITGQKLDKDDVLAEIMAEMHKALDQQQQKGDSAHIEYYRKHCVTLGQKVRWVDGGQEITGKAVDLNTEGNLILEIEGGKQHICSTGDIIHNT